MSTVTNVNAPSEGPPPGCTCVLMAPGTTHEIHLLGADQRVSPEWTVTNDPATYPLDCHGPSAYATGANIQTCGATADGAAICWAPPGQNFLYCGAGPWSRTVRRQSAKSWRRRTTSGVEASG